MEHGIARLSSRTPAKQWMIDAGIAYHHAAPEDEDTVRLVTTAGVALTFIERSAPSSFPPGLFALSHPAVADSVNS